MAAVRVALIGYGAVAGEHATVLADSTAAELVAVVGPRREAASRFAASHGKMERGVIDIDGFARLRVYGEEEMTERPATGDQAYHRAIARQDTAFLEALRDGPSFPVSPGEIARFNGVLGRAVQLAER